MHFDSSRLLRFSVFVVSAEADTSCTDGTDHKLLDDGMSETVAEAGGVESSEALISKDAELCHRYIFVPKSFWDYFALFVCDVAARLRGSPARHDRRQAPA